VQLLAARDGLRIIANHDKAGLALHLPGDHSPTSLLVSCDLIQTAANCRGDTVSVEPDESGVVLARWRDGDVPRQASFDVPRPVVNDEPILPANWTEQPANFLTALQAVMQVTDHESLRYALSCVQLDGDAGTLTATDGRQILSHRGWNFGFAGSVLVPANRVFGNRELTTAETVRIGKTDKSFVVQAGDWTVWLALNLEGRFPNVTDLLAATDLPATQLVIDQQDRRFLQENLPRLPERRDDNSAVTVDLNGRVAIRARDDSSPPTELVLNRSSRVGAEVRFCTDRRFLARALELGFAEVAIQDAEQPVVCRDDRRTYLWAILTPDSAIGPSPEAIVIESSPDGARVTPVTSSFPPTEHSKTMITNRIPPTNDTAHEPPAANGTAEPASIESIIDSAEQVKVALRDAATQVSDLIVALRRHRRQSKTLQSALSSIRALQTLDA